METPVKQRLIGALVLALVAILFLPMLLKPDVKAPDVSEVPLDMPAAPQSDFETHDLPLNVPVSKVPASGVLGVPSAPVESSNALAVPDAAVSAQQDLPVPTNSTPLTNMDASKPAVLTAPTPVVAKPAAVAVPVPVLAKPVPIEKPVEIKPSAVAAGNFIITIGSFTKIDSANALVARLKAQKMPVITEKIIVDGKPAMKVRIGPYPDRASAEAARLKADEIAGGTSKVNVQDAAPTAAVVSKPASSVVKAAVTTASGFSVQLDALSDKVKAEEMRNRARGLGFNAFVQRVDTEKGVLYSVRLGPVADREAAIKLRDDATKKLGKTGIVKSYP